MSTRRTEALVSHLDEASGLELQDVEADEEERALKEEMEKEAKKKTSVSQLKSC